MADSGLFISSCSRRQLARRRALRSTYRLQLWLAMLVILLALAALVAGHGGL